MVTEWYEAPTGRIRSGSTWDPYLGCLVSEQGDDNQAAVGVPWIGAFPAVKGDEAFPLRQAMDDRDRQTRIREDQVTTALDTGIVARIQIALNREDLDAVASELADDVVFHPPAGMDDSLPTLRGREAVIAHYESQLQAQSNGGLEQRIEPLNAEELAGHVVAVATVFMGAQGSERSFQTIEVCRLRDGKLAERWAMFDHPDIPRSIIDEMTDP